VAIHEVYFYVGGVVTVSHDKELQESKLVTVKMFTVTKNFES
jgi:hypothetical protein